MKNDTLIIVPAFNEEVCIAKTINDLIAIRLPVDILIINDGSRDSTAEIVSRHDVILISHPYNLGYGAAVQTGFKYACAHDYQFVIQFDADGQHDARDLGVIFDTLHLEAVDLVIGSRYLGTGPIRMGILKKITVRMIRFIIKIFTGAVITDPTSGLKGIRRRLFEYYAGMGHYPFDFPDADVLIRTLIQAYRMKEIPVNMRDRLAGTSMHSGLKPFYYIIRLFVAISIVLLQGKNGANAPKEGCEALHG